MGRGERGGERQRQTETNRKREKNTQRETETDRGRERVEKRKTSANQWVQPAYLRLTYTVYYCHN